MINIKRKQIEAMRPQTYLQVQMYVSIFKETPIASVALMHM